MSKEGDLKMGKLKSGVTISRRKVLKAGAVATAALAIGIAPTKLVFADSANAPKNPDKVGFMYDQELCIGCKQCSRACKKANTWEVGAEWRRVLKQGDTYLSISCNHCEKPACLTVCPVKAYTIREKDGAVIHNAEKCVGCKYCMYACPYHAPQFSDETGRITKCHFCSEKRDNGQDPACVSACPQNALTYGKLTELRKNPGAVSQIGKLPSADLTNPSLVIIPVKK